MAYNNGYSMGYQPMMPPYTQMNMFQQPNQQNTSQNANPNIVWVQGENAAKSDIVKQKQSIIYHEKEEQIKETRKNTLKEKYLKSADANGMPSTKILDYTIRDNTPITQQKADTVDYVTKADLEDIRRELNVLKAKIEPRNNKPSVRKEA